MQQPSLTIISATGHSDYTLGAMYAIMHSYQELRPQIHRLQCTLISPNRPTELPDYIKHIACKPFSYWEYNALAFYSLGQFVDTDFALIVQNDGWVFNGERWCDDFFDYDYIGAPIGRYFETNATHTLHYTDFWQTHYYPQPKNMREPQNGGFSLRSKALLDAPKKYGLHYQVCVEVSEYFPVEMRYVDNNLHEDVLLSGYHRAFLEAQGLRFAPREVAFRFALENALPLQLYNQYASEKITHDQILGRHVAGVITLIGINEVMVKGVKYDSLDEIIADDNLSILLRKGYKVRVPQESSFNGREIVVQNKKV